MKQNKNNHAWQAFQKAGLLAVMFTCFTLTASAQSSGGVKVKGVVTDAKQAALPSLAVKIKGTGTGVITDKEGEFVFDEPLQPGTVLVFSYLGMSTQEVTISEGMPARLSITMQEAPIEIVGATADIGPYESPSAWARFWNRMKD